ncbi:sister chromatid cohesion protein PDS5 homolog E-like isoform X1 [Brassica napus]|uniref:sister chromatid cohesion protein PDS5 homolog E-like isoform X1 n=1 Tax=Brassica napus TaxID=3708 RepID=UPI0006AA7CD0|nr:sister chromatid cohesion protein PDS5 homolog E-like isoform X1 [Brassica napus]XP_048614120.1 sister chromatid cohesion protein PDS5 homolog E-like isoform X1 [Brassica napus]
MLFSEEEKMGPLVGETELSEALVNAGKNLLKPPSSTKALLHLLNEAEGQLSKLVQDPIAAVQNALRPLMKALVSAHLLRNRDSDVWVYVVSCLTEIMRITAPEVPYNDDQMKEIFKMTVRAFGKLADTSCPSYKKAVGVLDTVSRVRLSLVMLDLECDDLILKMFRQFLKTIRPNHPESVLLSMEAIMVTVIHESEEVPMDLLEILLAALNKESQDFSPVASWLAEKVLITCACKLQTCIIEALKSTGTSLEMYSPVVLAICQGEAEAHIVVKPKQAEGNMSKRIARCGTRAQGDDNDLKQVQPGSTDVETESGSMRRGRELNPLMNTEEGYPFKTSSSKKVQEKELGDSSLGKLTAKKASLPSEVGQTNQSVVSSLSPSSKARKGSRKRSQSKIEETNLGAGSLAALVSKKQIVKKDDPEEEDFMESDLEKPEDSIKTAAKSSKKERAQNRSAKASAKKPLAESNRVEDSVKKSVHSESKGASMYSHILQSSKNKKKISRAITPPRKESEQTAKSHHKRKRTAGEEVESHNSELGEELVGKRLKVWWPLDKKFYEGVIKSYSSRQKKHVVSYTDGDVENLDLKKERWEMIQDNSSSSDEKEIDLPDSTLLSDIRRRQKTMKRKNVCKNVELSSSSDVRSSKKKSDPVANSTKLKGVSNEQESREKQNLESSKATNAEIGRTKGRTEKRQRVTRSMHQESEKDCDDKEEPETKAGGEELKSTNKSNAISETDGQEHKVAKEPAAKADGVERESAKEPNEEPNTEVQGRGSAKEIPACTTLIEEEDMSEESHRSVPETGKVENEDDQRVVKEETDKAEVGTIRVSV